MTSAQEFSGNSRVDRITVKWTATQDPAESSAAGIVAWAAPEILIDVTRIRDEIDSFHSAGMPGSPAVPVSHFITSRHSKANWGASAETVFIDVVSNLDTIGYAVASTALYDLLKGIFSKLRKKGPSKDVDPGEIVDENTSRIAMSALSSFYGLTPNQFSLESNEANGDSTVVFASGSDGMKYRVQIVWNQLDGVICRVDRAPSDD